MATLTQEELPDLSSGDIVQLRLNYLYNPERLPVTYVEAQCIDKRKRDGTFLLNGSDTPISISLTEVGRYAHDGWQMSDEELSKVKLRESVIIHEKSDERRPARYMGGESPYSAKVIYEGETELSSVLWRQIGPVE
jgi:hypothetical protein